MTCVKAESHVQCMYYIDQAGKGEAVGADVVVLDAGDIYRSVSRNLALFTQPRNNPVGYRAGWEFGLIPIMAEIYNLGTPHYYAVAVAHQRDNSSELVSEREDIYVVRDRERSSDSESTCYNDTLYLQDLRQH